jgi:hypothetical protein
VLLAFRLPRVPSTPRTALWRKLKQLGAAQLGDGLVALPRDGRTQEQLEWLAENVVDAGGEAAIWFGRVASPAYERRLAARMQEAVAASYRTVIADAASARELAPREKRRSLARLRRELRRIRLRDYFPPEERERARKAVDELATLVEEPVA